MTPSVLFVCMGNICRSPAAEGVMEFVANQQDISIQVDSAGTHDYHTGERADRRMRAAAQRRGIDLTSRARAVTPEDLRPGTFDAVVAMDDENMRNLEACYRSHASDALPSHVRLLSHWLDNDSEFPREVPDPYYGGDDGFELVLDMLQAACPAILEELGNTSAASAD
ncbi:MAG: low molecular weight protein-tyrosine-phosphatase [Planctomycetota bacterium]